MSKPSPAEVARAHRTRLSIYLAAGKPLPTRGGKLNVSAVAAECGFDRQVLYKNRTLREMLDAAVRTRGLVGIEPSNSSGGAAGDDDHPVPAAKLRAAQREIARLEKRLAEMTARNAALRAHLARRRHVDDDLVASGRRPWPGANPPPEGAEG